MGQIIGTKFLKNIYGKRRKKKRKKKKEMKERERKKAVTKKVPSSINGPISKYLSDFTNQSSLTKQ